MARRKNTKRIDPRYFLNETVNRGETIDEGVKDYIKSPAQDFFYTDGKLNQSSYERPRTFAGR